MPRLCIRHGQHGAGICAVSRLNKWWLSCLFGKFHLYPIIVKCGAAVGGGFVAVGQGV